MSLQRSSSGAQSVTIPSESTAKPSAFKGKILTLAVKLEERGYSESYLKPMVRALLEFSGNTDLHNPSEVSLYIAKKKVKDSYKANLSDYYKHYADYIGISYNKPKYRRDHELPYIPTKEELTTIISHASKKYALIYSILRDTGIRPIELSNQGQSNHQLVYSYSIHSYTHINNQIHVLTQVTISVRFYYRYVPYRGDKMTDKKSSLRAILTSTEIEYLDQPQNEQNNRKLDYTIRNRCIKAFEELIWILQRVKPKQRYKIVAGLLTYFDPDFFEAWLKDKGRIRGPIHYYLPRNLVQELIPYIVETALEFSKKIWRISKSRDPTSFMEVMKAKGLPKNRRFWAQWFGREVMEETFIHPLKEYFPDLFVQGES